MTIEPVVESTVQNPEPTTTPVVESPQERFEGALKLFHYLQNDFFNPDDEAVAKKYGFTLGTEEGQKSGI